MSFNFLLIFIRLNIGIKTTVVNNTEINDLIAIPVNVKGNCFVMSIFLETNLFKYLINEYVPHNHLKIIIIKITNENKYNHLINSHFFLTQKDIKQKLVKHKIKKFKNKTELNAMIGKTFLGLSIIFNLYKKIIIELATNIKIIDKAKNKTNLLFSL